VLTEEQFEKMGVKKFHLKKLLELQKSIKALKFDDERERFCEQDGMNAELSKLVSDFGAAAAQHVRPSMEDEHVAFRLNGTVAYFGVYDGHGGRQVATMCKHKLHGMVRDACASVNAQKQRPIGFDWSETHRDMERALQRAFLQCDELVGREVEDGALGCGATAGVVLVRKEGARQVLHVANCGDVRAVLLRGSQAVRLTVDHKADSVEERARIESAGGQVVGRRVQGVLAVARAFGDYALKRFVTAEPYVGTCVLQPGDSHVVLACDGLWDVLQDQDVCDLIRDMPEETNCLRIAKNLIAKAIALRTIDNISVVVIKLLESK
jgi:serine/threonine protein phosphatase PrpC